MIVIHHRLTTASKPAAKHAKPSSLKYADTTKRKTEKKKHIYLFIYSIGKGSRRGGGGMEVGWLQSVQEQSKANTRAAKEREEKWKGEQKKRMKRRQRGRQKDKVMNEKVGKAGKKDRMNTRCCQYWEGRQHGGSLTRSRFHRSSISPVPTHHFHCLVLRATLFLPPDTGCCAGLLGLLPPLQ